MATNRKKKVMKKLWPRIEKKISHEISWRKFEKKSCEKSRPRKKSHDIFGRNSKKNMSSSYPTPLTITAATLLETRPCPRTPAKKCIERINTDPD